MTTTVRSSAFLLTCTLALAAPTAARSVTMPSFGADSAAPERALAAVTFLPTAAFSLAIPPLPALEGAEAGQGRPRPIAVEYSDAYRLRAKIHKYASFATLPLFAAEIALGQSLYNDTPTLFGEGGSKRGAHGAVGSAIGVLWAANTVTGVWNLWEGRHDPNGRTLRWVHGLLMIAAGAGFVATAAAVPNRESFSGLINYEADKSTHRNIAFASIGVATLGYTIMLFGGK